MNILHLKYALEIASTGSLNKAAQNLYVGQPNLSRAIKELENDLNITIFKRSAKGMVPTAEGDEFLHYAKSILRQIEHVEDIYKAGKSAKQKFSISAPRASYIAEAFTEFSKKVGESEAYELFYRETNAMRAIKNILHEDYSLGIIRYAESYDKHFQNMLDEKGLISKTVTEFKYVIAMSASHPLAEKENVLYSDLEHYIEIAHADPYVPTLPFSVVLKEELPDNCQKRIFVFERASQFEILSENKNTFMWVSPAPEKALQRYGLVLKSSSENTKKYKDVLIYRKDYHLSELDNIFISELNNAKHKHIK